MAKQILKNELLFHSTHGLCRVATVTYAAPSIEASCSLITVPQSRSKSRFTVPLDLLSNSGFNRLVTPRDALAILDYLKTGEKKKSAQGNAWSMAETLRAEARSKEIIKDKRRGQELNQLVKSFANELTIALQSTLRETLAKIQESLEPLSKVNPVIITALTNADGI